MTVTVTATATVTATRTVATTQTATATVTHTAEPVPIGPIDVTAEYTRHAVAAHMEQTQREDIVQATMYDGVLEVLTTMRYPGGGWNCDAEPTTLARMPVKFVRILRQDNTIFRICN